MLEITSVITLIATSILTFESIVILGIIIIVLLQGLKS